MARKTNQNPSGTSFHDTVIYTTVNELLNLFPDSYSDGDGGYKVYHEFTLETDDGDVFTIYDWKEYEDRGKYTEIEFHIGGFNRRITEQAREELEEMLDL